MKRLILLPGGVLALALLALVLWPEPGAQGPGIEVVAEQSARSRPPVTREAIPDDDLPPAGTRSLFDHLVRENGSLPYPFDRVIAMLQAQDGGDGNVRTLLIPDGRSLLKGFADFARPRIVVAADMQPPAGAELPPDYRGRLFLGFVEAADEIEVLSYNAAAGRFEFQLVENYCAGCVPRIVYAKRAICQTCHASGGPIFPVRPWEETNVQPAIVQRLTPHIDGDMYFGAPLRRKLDDGQAFDDLTDLGNVAISTQQIWLDGCGADGDECRRQMLRLAWRYLLNPAALDQAGPAVDALRAAQAESWPEAGIALHDNNLNNRNPLEQALYSESLWVRLRNIFASEPELRAATGDKLKDFDRLPPLPAEFDPLTPRPAARWIQADELDGVYGVAQFFTAADVARVEEAAKFSSDAVLAAIDDLPAAIFSARPLQRVAVLQGMINALEGAPPGHCCADAEGMSEPILQGEPPLELSAGSPLAPFETYCFACHRGNPSAELNFMSGDSEQIVLEQIAERSEIRDVLDFDRYLGTSKAGRLMPPADSWQREKLEQALAAGEEPLAAMREQVPALFEF